MPYIDVEGSVARFVFKTRDFFSDTGKPKPNAFKPEFYAEAARYETSVCGMIGTSRERLRELGVTIRPGLTAIAAVEVPVSRIVDCALACEEAPDGAYVEHGVIVGWSDDKSAHMSLQMELAADPCTVYRPL